MPHLVHQRANAREARVVVRLAKIDRAADFRVHFRAAQFFGGNFLSDCRLHQRRPREKESRTFRHQDVIAHHGQIRAARDAHSHDGRDLGNAHGAHDGVVAEHAAEIVGVGEDVFLQRQENASGIDQVNRGNMIVDGNILRANHFFRREREESPGFHRRVVGDDHHQTPADSPEAGDRARGRRAAPLLVHFVRGVNSQLEKRSVRIDQLGDALARGQAALLVLRFDGLRAAALLNRGFLVLDFREQVHHAAGILLEVGRVSVDLGFNDGTRQVEILQKYFPRCSLGRRSDSIS